MTIAFTLKEADERNHCHISGTMVGKVVPFDDVFTHEAERRELRHDLGG